MSKRTTKAAVVLVLAMMAGVLYAGQTALGVMEKGQLEQMAGQAVEISPWTYEWRADRAVQDKPEAYFIPRRLERIDTVYRTASTALPPDQLKSIFYDLQDLVKELPPKPKGSLQAGLLWTGGVVDYEVELNWPAKAGKIPAPDAVEVRVYPTSWGWFGWTVDKIMGKPEVSADGRKWTYKSEPGLLMDAAYNGRVPAATEMVAVFFEGSQWGDKTAVPDIRVTGPSLGQWKRMDVEIEWGFQPGTEKSEFEGRIETHVALTGAAAALAEDKGTKVTGGDRWQSQAAGEGRRGIVLPVLYAPNSRPGLDSRVTVWMKADGFTFRVSDLEKGSIWIPQHGVFVTKAGSGQTARQYAQELAAKNLKSIRQMVREHREAVSWEEVMKEVRIWTCPEGTELKPFPAGDDPVMMVELPDAGWTGAWRAATNQLRGPHMWGGLGFEVGRVARDMELIGLHDKADAVYGHFLKSPGIKSDGDYTDGAGSLEWASAMRHDMGYSHDGTHASTGRVLFAMTERYFLTGDKEWFQKNRLRLQAAADWIIRQRKLYMLNVPKREELFVAGLLPPEMLGDYAIPTCDWHWYYMVNVFSVQAVQRFGDVLAEFEPEMGAKYQQEAEAYRKDLRRAAEQEAALSPVRLGRDGMHHSFIPRMAYAGGLTGPELGAPQFPECDMWVGSLPLAELMGALEAGDYRMMDTLDMMEEMGTSVERVREREEARKQKGLPTEEAWFWHCYSMLPKASHTANIYLLQDDIPNFLRFFFNTYASMVGADGKIWEHWHLGQFTNCEAPDNGTAGWFMENFRNLLVMEEGQSLWIAKATPRAWLEQGKKISVKNAPTYFGTLAYEMVSDVENGKISATVEIPSRYPVQNVLVRFRHPQGSPIKSVTVNGQPWNDFDAGKEIIRLHDVSGTVQVTATY